MSGDEYMDNQMNLTIQRMYAMRKLFEACNQPVCDKYGISQTEAVILLFLHNNPENDTASDIVEYRYIPKANVSKSVESLFIKGFLERKNYTNDRRKIHLTLTEQAIPCAEELFASCVKYVQILFDGFTDEEKMLYDRMNTKLADNAAKGLQR